MITEKQIKEMVQYHLELTYDTDATDYSYNWTSTNNLFVCQHLAWYYKKHT